MTETWKPIRGYEDRYEVSTCGRVRNSKTGYVITPKVNDSGRHHVILYVGRKGRSFLVHRLVAEAFIPTEDTSLTINHIDEDPLNNNVENLEWCSIKENIQKFLDNRKTYGLVSVSGKKVYKTRSGNHNSHPKYVGCGRKENPTHVIQMNMDGTFVKEWPSAAETKRILGYNTWSISQCCNGKRHTAYGYKWQYAV